MHTENLNLDAILEEWGFRVDNGMPDITNESHLDVLALVLREHNVSNEFIMSYLDELRQMAQIGLAKSSKPIDIIRESKLNEDRAPKDNKLPSSVSGMIKEVPPARRNKVHKIVVDYITHWGHERPHNMKILSQKLRKSIELTSQMDDATNSDFDMALRMLRRHFNLLEITEASKSTSDGKYQAINKKSGKLVNFNTADALKAAVKAGTHTLPKKEKPAAKKDKKAKAPEKSTSVFKGKGEKVFAKKDKKAPAPKAELQPHTYEQKKDKNGKNIQYGNRNKELDQHINTVKTEAFNLTLDDDKDFAIRNKKTAVAKQIDISKEFKTLGIHTDKFPKRYIQVLNRMLNSYVPNKNAPTTKLSHFVKDGGAGAINAQAGEIMTFISSTLSDSEAEKFYTLLDNHISAQPKEQQKHMVVNTSWVKAARKNRLAIFNYLHKEFGDSVQIQAACWDNNTEAAALGFFEPGLNKEGATDMYMKVRDIKSGKSYLVEVSLKKDGNIRMTSSTPTQMYGLADFTPNDEAQFDKSLASKGEKLTVVSPPPPAGLKDITDGKRQKTRVEILGTAFLGKGIKTPDSELSPADLKEMKAMLSTAAKMIKADPELQKMYMGLAKGGSFDKLDTVEDKIKLIFKGGANRRDSAKLMIILLDKLASKGNKNAAKALDTVIKQQDAFSNNVVLSMAHEPIKTKMLENIRDSLPVLEVISGALPTAIGDLSFDVHTAKIIFGTDNLNEIKEHLVPDITSDPPTVKYIVKGKTPITVATVGVRDDGLIKLSSGKSASYGSSKFEMLLHKDFESKLRKANETIYGLKPAEPKKGKAKK